MFATINCLDDLRPHIEGNNQFRIQEQPCGYTVVCYMLQDEDTFTGENEIYAKECRGITFDRQGKIASRTMHKFQNVGENEHTQFDNIPWQDVYRLTDKRDGSMITFVLMDGMVVGKTKKTFSSNEAIAATKRLCSNQFQYEWVRGLLENGITPTFEFTSPHFPIVLQYKEESLTLLQVRKNVSGEYAVFTDCEDFYFPSEKDVVYVSPFHTVKNLIKDFSKDGVFDPHSLMQAAANTEGIEGWIVQVPDGRMWKVKTAWYCKLHHAVTFVRWRDIAKAVVAGTSDDLKAAFSMVGKKIDPIVQVENTIATEIQQYKDDVNAMVILAQQKHGTCAKSIALDPFFKNSPMFGHVMRTMRGQEIDYVDWYSKNRIDAFGLEVVVDIDQ